MYAAEHCTTPRAALRGHAPAVAWFAGLTDVPSVPGFVVMELIQDARDKREVRRALKLVAPLPIVWPSEADCQRALSDSTTFHHSHGVGLLDSLIAPCAIGLSATLCTFNSKHYAVIPGLDIDEPYMR